MFTRSTVLMPSRLQTPFELAALPPTSALRRSIPFLLAVAAMVLSACGGGGTDSPTQPPAGGTAVTSIAVTAASSTLQSVGATTTVTASLTPSNAAGSVTWTSSEPTVATVAGSGLTATVTAVAAGTTVIRATSTSNAAISATANITVSISAAPVTLRSVGQLRGIDIGAAVNASAMRSEADYRRVLGVEFSSLTPENAMKFGPIHPAAGSYSFTDADTIVGFAVANNQRVHGHVLLWHSQQPAWLTAGTPTRASLLAALKEHIETVVGRYAGRIASWDVANEMIADNNTGLRESFWTTIVGPDVIDSAFTWARRRDPAAKLYLNDYNVETVNAKSDSLFALASRLKARGVPIDGVGLQAHFVLPAPTTAQLAANMSRFAAAGFDLRITELDIRIADGSDGLAAQATGYANVAEACRAQPRCRAVTMWGFTDKYSWVPSTFAGFGRALPFDASYLPKPAYTSFRDALARP